MSNTVYGIVVAAFPVGALIAGPAAGAVIRRLTSARATLVCTVGIAVPSDGAPPLVGAVSDATSLRVGLVVVPIAGLIVVAAAGVFSARRRPTRS